jgi:nicotinate-nucleotide pyrophosphorylase (carboxylating)
MEKHHLEIANLVKAALAEDIGPGDLTSLACLEPNPAKAKITAKGDGVLSGLTPFELTFHFVDSANVVSRLLADGDRFRAGDVIAEIRGFNMTLLSSERVALNFLAHLSGVATLTAAFVEKVAGTGCKILDTRKTTPGWRHLEKIAVTHGGGTNHRMGLYDMMLVKDNHIASAGSIEKAIEQARAFLATPDFRLQFERSAAGIEIEAEVTSPEQVREAINAGVNRLLLDNQSPESLTELAALARQLDPTVKLEASGNVSLENVAAIAATGVDYISIGSLTHSAPVCDFSMNLVQ